MFGRQRRPEGRTPSDLPPRYWWARDEIVNLRLRTHDLSIENMKLRMALAEAHGRNPFESTILSFRSEGLGTSDSE